MWADIFTDFERRETLGRPSDDDYACGMVDGGAGLAYMQLAAPEPPNIFHLFITTP